MRLWEAGNFSRTRRLGTTNCFRERQRLTSDFHSPLRKRRVLQTGCRRILPLPFRRGEARGERSFVSFTELNYYEHASWIGTLFKLHQLPSTAAAFAPGTPSNG